MRNRKLNEYWILFRAFIWNFCCAVNRFENIYLSSICVSHLLTRKSSYMFHFIFPLMSVRTTRQKRQSRDPGRSETVAIPPSMEKTQL